MLVRVGGQAQPGRCWCKRRLPTPQQVQGGVGDPGWRVPPNHKGLGSVGVHGVRRGTAVLLLWVPEPSTQEAFCARVPTACPPRYSGRSPPLGLICSFIEHFCGRRCQARCCGLQ